MITSMTERIAFLRCYILCLNMKKPKCTYSFQFPIANKQNALSHTNFTILKDSLDTQRNSNSLAENEVGTSQVCNSLLYHENLYFSGNNNPVELSKSQQAASAIPCHLSPFTFKSPVLEPQIRNIHK